MFAGSHMVCLPSWKMNSFKPTNQTVTRARSQVYQRALHRVRTGAYPLLVWLYNIGMPRKCHVMYEKEMADGDGRV